MRAKAAKARLSYVEEEINLKLEKVKLEASMGLLNYKKEPAAANADTEAHNAVDLDSEKHSSN